VGKALDARPDISRALVADGHLLGNHSYHHDQWWWLDPLAGLAVAAVAIKEGRAAWRGENCCASVPGLSAEEACGCGPGCTDACCAGEVHSAT